MLSKMKMHVLHLIYRELKTMNINKVGVDIQSSGDIFTSDPWTMLQAALRGHFHTPVTCKN